MPLCVCVCVLHLNKVDFLKEVFDLQESAIRNTRELPMIMNQPEGHSTLIYALHTQVSWRSEERKVGKR